MKYPELADVTYSMRSIDTFYGLNKDSVISAGEFADCLNLTNDKYPALTLRDKRAILSRFTGEGSVIAGCKALFYNEALGYICSSANDDGTWGYIYYGSTRYDLPFASDLDDVSIANMGRRVIINNAVPTSRKAEMCVFDLSTKTVQLVEREYLVANKTVEDNFGLVYVTGGEDSYYCHLRVLYDNGTYPSSIMQTVVTDELPTHEACMRHGATDANYNMLVRCGEGDSATWIQILGAGAWQAVDKVIFRFCIPDVGDKFRVGDYIELSGLGCYSYTTDASTDAVKNSAKAKDEAVGALNGWHEIVGIKKNEDGYGWSIDILCDIPSWALMQYLISTKLTQFCETEGGVASTLSNDMYLSDGSSFKRQMPKLVYICECGNRIWGCGYDNSIYACEIDNPYNWYRYEGTLLDSYAAATGEDGEWTGAINYLDSPIFFKEDMMYRVTGDLPSNFYVYKYSCRGVMKTCYDSLCVVNDALYYQASDGIYRYTQSTPVCVSDKVHSPTWRVGKAGKYKDKYMLSVIDDNYVTGLGAYNHNRELYSYDTVRGIWQKEDSIYAYDFVGHDNTLYILESTATDVFTVYMLDDKVKADEYEDTIEWYAETSVLTTGSGGRNYIRKIRLDGMLDRGSEMSVYIQYDNDGRWQKVKALKEQKRNTVAVQIIPRRCDNIRLRLSGRGGFELYSITMKYTKGSDRR